MAAFFEQLSESHQQFVERQHLFFVSTAAESGEVNLSPKGMDSLRILSPSRLLWLNLTGSGNETAAHIQRINRMTLMWCSFEKKPLILRVYGKARAVYPHESRWATLVSHFPDDTGARQIFEVDIHQVQSSCGFAVPFFEYAGDRNQLTDHWLKRGIETLPEYWEKRNSVSIDGFDTGLQNERRSKK